MGDDLVRVALRIRPLVQSEIERGCKECLRCVPGEPQIQIISQVDKSFRFNFVFPPESAQEEFYNTAIKDIVTNVFKGYNVTILAYGQTGSGKTYSMGTNYSETDVNIGIIPRAVNDIFQTIQTKDDYQDWNVKVFVSFMELYQEQLYDLLSKKPRHQNIIDLREDSKGVKAFGLTEVEVANTDEALRYLAEGSMSRATGSTAMNMQSSRSHAIFTLLIQQQKKNDPNTAKVSKFHLVDLAGSERSKKTQATGERFKEGVNINKGLLALGNVITKLGEGGESYISYRDSKLTRLLQDSLGGNSMTLMIACVSPADYNLEESLSTLRYADRARKIKNKPIVNEDPRVAEINRLKNIIRELQTSVFSYSSAGGNYCPPEHEELDQQMKVLQNKLRSVTEKLNSSLIEIVHLHEQANVLEQFREKIKQSTETILHDLEELLSECKDYPDSQKMKLENIRSQIVQMQKEQSMAAEEMVNRELSIDSLKSPMDMDCTSESTEENSLHNETYDVDAKHEEHTLQQAEKIDEVQQINQQLAIKEQLVTNLLRDCPSIFEYHKEVSEMENEIKTLQAEKEELMETLKTVQTNNASSKLSETRRKKVQELEKKISELSRKVLEQNKIIKAKERSDQQVKNLSSEIFSLKQAKVKLIRSLRSEAETFNKWKRSRDQEVYKLKDQDRKRQNQISRLRTEQTKQQNVFKRKLEEAQAVNKRLKDALDLQKKVQLQRREKSSTNKDDVQSWVSRELDVLYKTIEAECSLDRLKQDKDYIALQLKELNNDSRSSTSSTGKQISNLTEYLELRNAQIKALEQQIAESNQENRSKTRWQTIATMSDAKDALKTIFDVYAKEKKEIQMLKSEYNELKEKHEDLKKNQIKESKSLFKKDLHNSIEDLENFETLQNELTFYKDRCADLENKVLTETKENIPNKMKVKVQNVLESDDSYIIGLSDDSFVDDDENDPDWRRTPLYSRIQKFENSTRLMNRESRVGLKRSSDGDVKCSCKTKCITRVCSCRKNGTTCSNCNCNPELCQNKDQDNTKRTLFTDIAENTSEAEEFKKPRLSEEQH